VNMQRVKTVVIFLLVIINIALAALLVDNSSRYKLSERQKAAISTILSQNNVGLYTLVPTDFRPMRMLLLQPYAFEEEALRGLFFGAEEPERAEEQSERRVSLTQANAELYLEPSRLIYQNPDGYLPPGYAAMPATPGDIQRMLDSLVEKLAPKQLTLVLDKYMAYGEEQVYEYRASYRGHVLYTSYVKCKVTAAGVTELRSSLSIPDGYTGEERDIFSCDEALLSLLGELKSIYGNMESEVTMLTGIDMVYYLEEAAQSGQSEMKAVPYYRIYTRTSPELPFLINAYNNKVLR